MNTKLIGFRQSKVNPTAEDEESNTSLHLACHGKHPAVVKTLLTHGSNSHSRNAKKWTPLGCAANVGATNCAQMLLEVCSGVIHPVPLIRHNRIFLEWRRN